MKPTKKRRKKLVRFRNGRAPMVGGPSSLTFVVLGEPQGKGRPIGTTSKTGTIRMVTPRKTRHYETRIAQTAELAVVRAGWGWAPGDRFLLLLTIRRIHEDRGPDADNIVKAVADACNDVAWTDDRHLRWGWWSVELVTPGEEPHIEVKIYKVTAAQSRKILESFVETVMGCTQEIRKNG